MARFTRQARFSQMGGGNRSGLAGQMARGSMKIKITETLTRNLPKIRMRIDKAGLKSLDRAGAYIMRVAKNSFKVDRGTRDANGNRATAKAGHAPVTHKNRAMKNSIRFDTSKWDRKVTIGAMTTMIGDSADVHEHGGTKQVKIKKLRPKSKVQRKKARKVTWSQDAGKKARQKQHIKNNYIAKRKKDVADGKLGTVMAHYEARPFMQPALVKSRPHIPKLFENQL